MTSPYRFYAAEISYFSGKVRPALRQKGVVFVEHLPTPAAYREVILPRTGLAFIPIVVTPDDETWQDTSEILDALEARHPEPALYPPTQVQRAIAYLIELYADEFLVLPAMHYRWSFPEGVRKARGDFAATNGDPVAAAKFADRMGGSIPRARRRARVDRRRSRLIRPSCSTSSPPTSPSTRRCSARACRSPIAR